MPKVVDRDQLIDQAMADRRRPIAMVFHQVTEARVAEERRCTSQKVIDRLWRIWTCRHQDSLGSASGRSEIVQTEVCLTAPAPGSTDIIQWTMGMIEDFAARNPHSAEKRGGEIFVDASAAGDLINEAESSGIGILGMEGFIIGEATYPALSRIADLSMDDNNRRPDFVAWSCREARALILGPWRSAPVGSADQIHPHAAGRYMVAFTLDDQPGS